MNMDSSIMAGSFGGIHNTHQQSTKPTCDERLTGNYPKESCIEVSRGRKRAFPTEFDKQRVGHELEVAEAGTSYVTTNRADAKPAPMLHSKGVNMAMNLILPESLRSKGYWQWLFHYWRLNRSSKEKPQRIDLDIIVSNWHAYFKLLSPLHNSLLSVFLHSLAVFLLLKVLY